jgi:hypothetical protein
MFFWIYDLPAFSVIILFEAVFVGVFWLGALLLRPFVRAWLHEEARLDDMLAGIPAVLRGHLWLTSWLARSGDLPKPIGCRKEQCR